MYARAQPRMQASVQPHAGTHAQEQARRQHSNTRVKQAELQTRLNMHTAHVTMHPQRCDMAGHVHCTLRRHQLDDVGCLRHVGCRLVDTLRDDVVGVSGERGLHATRNGSEYEQRRRAVETSSGDGQRRRSQNDIEGRGCDENNMTGRGEAAVGKWKRPCDTAWMDETAHLHNGHQRSGSRSQALAALMACCRTLGHTDDVRANSALQSIQEKHDKKRTYV